MIINEVLKGIKIKKIGKAAKKYPNKISLCKDNKYENIEIDFSKQMISASNKKDIEILKQKIKDFLIVMHTKCDNFDDTIFMNNIKKTFFDISNTQKEYDTITSDISFCGNCNVISTNTFCYANHDFLLLSSFTGAEYISYSTYGAYKRFLERTGGWYDIQSFDDSLEIANKWYIKLLEERYFEIDENEFKHPISNFVLSQIEYILGKDFLEKSYFTGNFKLDLFTLTNYASRADFFILFDYVKDLSELEEEMQRENCLKIEKLKVLFGQISFILFKCIAEKTYLIAGKNNRIDFLNSNECFFKKIIFSLNGESVAIDFYNDKLIEMLYNEIDLIMQKIKEIN